MSIILANCILAAAKINQDSYDVEAAEAQSRPGMNPTYVDFARFYRTPLDQACTEACVSAGQPILSEAVYLLLDVSWNEALDWANKVIKGA